MDVFLDIFYEDCGDPYTIELNDASELDMVKAIDGAMTMLEDDGHTVQEAEVWPKSGPNDIPDPNYDNDTPYKTYSWDDIYNYLHSGIQNCRSIW